MFKLNQHIVKHKISVPHCVKNPEKSECSSSYIFTEFFHYFSFFFFHTIFSSFEHDFYEGKIVLGLFQGHSNQLVLIILFLLDWCFSYSFDKFRITFPYHEMSFHLSRVVIFFSFPLVLLIYMCMILYCIHYI